MNNKDKQPVNDKGQPHGYWETYWSNGNTHLCGNFINGKSVGVIKFYNHDGELYEKHYYII